MGTAQNNSHLRNPHAVEFDLCNKDVMADTFDHSVISVGEEEGADSFQRSLPTRDSLRSPRGSIVSFHNIQYSVKQSSGFLCRRKTVEKKILHNVYGIMKPGLNAILGPTGSGKSSLLDVLAARKDPAGLSGEVLIDGIPQPPNFKCISGYVVQDDVVMGTMTVRENLHFSAALRLPSSISFQEKEERVTQIIGELGLSKVADAKVGTELIRGVSGGERKRTNIGMELITEPPVLFLDEPTTGLDASTANAVLILLKKLSRRGRTIIFSIHQPRYSIFKLFDSLTLLALGKVLYHGPAKQALEYFSSIGYECEPFNNPADFFLDIINGDSTAVAASKEDHKPADTGKEASNENGRVEENMSISVVDTLHQKYLNSSLYESTKEALGKVEREQGRKKKVSKKGHEITYANGFFTQLYWVSKRSLKNLIRNPQASIAQIAVTVILALVVGAIFFGVKLDESGIQNRVGSLFFVTTNQCFSSVSAIELFIRDKKLFVHQYTSGYYRVSAYFLALMLGDLLPMRTAPAIIFSCITYWMIGFQAIAGRFFFFMLALVMVSYTATAMSLAISAGMEVVAVANLLITICFVLMLIFSGLLVNLPSVMGWLNWLKYFSIPRYGLTALQVNEFRDLYFCGDKPNVTVSVGNATACPPVTSGVRCSGEDYLISQGIAPTNMAMWENIVALLCMTVIFLLIAYLKLRFMRKFT
ncbi:broad substrate specificity ATP-binding cassette transporter ABCG2 isoform X1 [Gallus gallus]|uniref:ATP-binding cassette sub-family G member 2 n=1 Tax=Gallus gallus TaxID=9031 RepID=E1C5B1_CHICK|nr:broad substrate specificity ATP-binding cassette transporter ABCG2 isoform X1 [Gallus gallus]XP_046776171.1 broad substrate specificity ATP-binding cassette transporter ABCG2 isoform X1 [Gallus gallus]ANI21144.1 ATP-binding cassette sub-family G member 2 [Gallus gallus]|eukprot:NP_001315419.1 ATP-binding cassette sub-family G member 2 [Gallus gallus]